MNASGADDGHHAPAAPGGATAPDIAALAGLVEQLGIAPAPLGSAAREQVNAARLAIRRVMKQYDVLPSSLFETVIRAGVHERDPSLCGTLFIIPAVKSYGFQRVMTAPLGYLRDGTGRRVPPAALRPARHPAVPAHPGRHHHRRRRAGLHPARQPAHSGPRAVRRDAYRTGRQSGEHEDRRQPRVPVAVPRAARRAAPDTAQAPPPAPRTRHPGHPGPDGVVPPACLQAPPPVVARALGYDYGTAADHAIAAGGTWNRYPAAHRSSPSATPNRGVKA
jgi:hypothetical protein